MNKTIFIFSFSFLLLNLQSCNSNHVTEEENSSEAMMSSEQVIQETTVNTTESEQELTVDKSLTKDTINLNKTIEETIKRSNQLDKKESYYSRTVSVEGTFGNVHFYNGTASKIVFSDEEIGMNGQYICYFDAKENLIFITAFDHGNTWYRNEYFVVDNNTLFTYFDLGDFADGVSSDIQLTKPKESWMTLEKYEKTRERANHLKQEAIYNQTELEGTRYYSGLIDQKHEVFMQLNEFNDWAYGKYHYNKNSSDLSLSVKFKEDSIIMTESVKDQKTGIFRGVKNENGEINGFWENIEKTKKLPFKLSPSKTYTTIKGEVLKSIKITPEEVEMYGNQLFGTD